MQFGKISNSYPGKRFARAQKLRDNHGLKQSRFKPNNLRGRLNRTRMVANVQHTRLVASQVFNATYNASQQSASLAIQQMNQRLLAEAQNLGQSLASGRVDVTV